MAADLFKDGVSRYKPEDWENDPLETTRSPYRDANVRELKYSYMKAVGIALKPINMLEAEWNDYQEWLKTAME